MHIKYEKRGPMNDISTFRIQHVPNIHAALNVKFESIFKSKQMAI